MSVQKFFFKKHKLILKLIQILVDKYPIIILDCNPKVNSMVMVLKFKKNNGVFNQGCLNYVFRIKVDAKFKQKLCSF